jgi:hypothetical protein
MGSATTLRCRCLGHRPEVPVCQEIRSPTAWRILEQLLCRWDITTDESALKGRKMIRPYSGRIHFDQNIKEGGHK